MAFDSPSRGLGLSSIACRTTLRGGADYLGACGSELRRTVRLGGSSRGEEDLENRHRKEAMSKGKFYYHHIGDFRLAGPNPELDELGIRLRRADRLPREHRGRVPPALNPVNWATSDR